MTPPGQCLLCDLVLQEQEDLRALKAAGEPVHDTAFYLGFSMGLYAAPDRMPKLCQRHHAHLREHVASVGVGLAGGEFGQVTHPAATNGSN